MKATWRIDTSSLKTLCGMIIDRDEAWRADAEMAPVIEAAIRDGIKNIDESMFSRVYVFLRWGHLDEEGCRRPLPGSYETYGLDEKQMAKAWKKYLRRKGYATN